ncbi:MAG: ATP-dependent endonuclease [Thaumarchaeota archaeon]|nr:ATP-dependent endonuclease [Nitrososphaerota archaeon]
MIIKSIRVKNFRSIKDETIYCDKLTALVGANGSGKSSFLHAMELFYNKSSRLDLEDYYDKDTSEDIVISTTFTELSSEATQLFSKYVQKNELTVERIFKWNEGRIITQFHGSTLQNPNFVEINEGNATDAKKKYDELKSKPEYASFPSWVSHIKTKEFLQDWEIKNPTKCERLRDDGQFFGFNEVAQGFLGKFIRFLYIPAVRDATSDASEGRGSVLTELMDLVIRNSISNKPEIKELEEQIKKKYAEILDPTKLTELTTLASDMTKTLQNFVPDAKIDLAWQVNKEFELKMPEAIARLVEDGYQSTVARTGHGLQRAFIMTILQHLSLAQNNSTSKPTQTNRPNLVLVVEEPELYQHPNRQRHLADVFLALSEGKISGVSEKMQIIYSTHSPHFVGIDRIDQIRLLRKTSLIQGKPKVTKISSTNLSEVAKDLSTLHGQDQSTFNVDTLIPRLHAIMTPLMNEGFFANVVVLVEGEADRAALMGVSKSIKHKFESDGFSIIPCSGKNNLDRPTMIFRKLGIPVYVMWDSDKGKKDARPEDNHHLLKLVGHTVEDWPAYIGDNSACFEDKLETTLKMEIGEQLFEKCICDCEGRFSMPRKHAIKNPVVISTIIEEAKLQGKSCVSLENIIQKIYLLNK